MAADHPAAEPPSPQTPTPGRRELAVARSDDPVRDRAEEKVRRFLDAALELVTGARGKDFTVQDVVRTSGQSLRSFYQYFDGKQELLLALLEESARRTADRLREVTAEEPDAAARLRRFTRDYHRLCRPRPADREHGADAEGGGAPAELARRLLTDHPRAAARAFAPLRLLLEEILHDAAREGAVRPGLDHRLVAGTLLQAVLFHPFALAVGGTDHEARDADADADALWDLLARGITSP
ncbi:TetR family transcriptional regulator [Streptomyces sp. NPDC047130]|uniref:TetR/AcrR family transcriptional regulator n=1 Tax=Streptomyces sp. NPDC047130 TaxID=3155261 RepID=UPI00340009D3